MFQFSSKTNVNKNFKLTDILKQIKADKDIKSDATKINSIVLSHVINSQSINTREVDKYKEIYIFKIDLNTNEIPKLFLEALDKSIKLHTYFVFTYKNKIYTTMCYKEIGKVVKLNKYYYHEFHTETSLELPNINSVEDVYKVIYSHEVQLQYRSYEGMDEFVGRVNRIHKLVFQISKTESAIKWEAQPKKKFEYHTRLLNYKKELEQELKVEEQ